MNLLRHLLTVLVLAVFAGASAQLVTTQPNPLQQGSMGIILTYHADSPLGNKGLANLPDNTDIYAHIGVLTTKSKNSGDWKYAPFPWPSAGNDQQANTSRNRLTRTAPNVYTLEIGSIADYFGITDATETVTDIALVFRTADGSREGKTAEEQDIFVPVLPDGFQINFSCDAVSTILSEATDVTFTLAASSPADLKISIGGTAIASASASATLTKTYTFSQTGTYDVVATATLDGVTRTSTIQIAYPDNSGSKPYPGGGRPQMGAVKNADGSVTFCLGAPGKKSAMIVGAWDDYQLLESNVMNYCDYDGQRYFWITIPNLPDDQWLPYYYVVDNIYKVGDPYAHLTLNANEDASVNMDRVWPDRPRYPKDKVTNGVVLAVYRGDMDNYNFDPFTIPDHDNLVVYELLLRDFTGTDGAAAGNGNLREAMARIPYLKSLGVNVIELMPIMEFNGNNSWGYNTNFYMAPDKIYGSPTDYKDFINECHRNGMAVVLDIVFNQSDGLHPWYKLYPRATNPFYNATAPHQYSVLNDWNQGNPLVQQQWTDAIKYWMTAYNVDGFRFDLVKGLGDNESYAQAGGTEQYNQSRIDRMIRLHGVIKSIKPNGIHINEDLASAAEEKVLGNDGQLQWANINNASCQFTMGWDNGNNNLYRFLSTSDARPWGSTVSYAESHDEERMAYKNATWGVDGVKLPDNSELTITEMSLKRLGCLAAQMLMIPGPKMIWQFGELGNGQTTKKSNGDNNTSSKIVCWYYLEDPGRVALKDTYASVINLRMANPELFSRDATFQAKGIGSKFTAPRTIHLTSGTKEAIAFINPAHSGADMDIECDASMLSPTNCQLICATPGFSPVLQAGSAAGKVKVVVPVNSFAIFATQTVTGIDDALVGDNPVNVFGAQGRIVIAGNYGQARVFNLSGMEMPSLEVQPGMYVVVVDGTSHKVVVR